MNSLDPFFYTELHIDVARDLDEYHRSLRAGLEVCLGKAWRVTKITAESTSAYDATRLSRTRSPLYIPAQITATLNVEARENGALEEIIDDFKVSIPRKMLRFKAELMSNGHLRITESSIEVPTKQ